MFRTLHILLLTTSLTACPFKCMGALQASDDGSRCATAATCRCCAKSSLAAQAPAEQRPSIPIDDCECGSCLCKGAVIDSGNPDVDDLSAQGWLPPDVSDLSESKARTGRPEEAENTPLGDAGGRAVRILQQSFLC